MSRTPLIDSATVCEDAFFESTLAHQQQRGSASVLSGKAFTTIRRQRAAKHQTGEPTIFNRGGVDIRMPWACGGQSQQPFETRLRHAACHYTHKQVLR